jgi:rhamnulose-1-phosphate aldolase/alcohol dehydrogenase
MGKHGLVNWGETSQECYDNSIRTIQEAEDFIQSRRNGRRIYAGATTPSLTPERRRQIFAEVLPALRGAVSKETPAILHLDTSDRVLEFVNSQHAAEWSQIGAACPDHLVHTKRQPLFVDWKPANGDSESAAALAATLVDGVQAYVQRYRTYFDQCKHSGDEMRDPAPRVILIPGLGMVNTGPDALGAEVSNQLYQRAIAVIEGSQSLDRFISLTAQEAYDVEYWPLELYKLQLRPAPRELAGRVAVVTGAASGIGRATARRLAEDGAHVAIFDINLDGARAVAEELCQKYGRSRSVAVHCNVTSEEAVEQAFQEVVLAYGGIDVVVSNAGIAISAPLEKTTVADWNKTMDILGKGYFLVSRAAFDIWKRQNMGGSLIYVASKNSVFAGKNAAVYSAAKAAELHMARCLAEEGGAFGIRVNAVLPDAVLQGSGIWDAGWREARASSYGIASDELDEFYRQRTTLKVNVYPENIAEAISFLAGPRASRTTGASITVDGGVAAAFMR